MTVFKTKRLSWILSFLFLVRMILFCIVWGLTFGKHHFWLLPNLTEDVGFFDSFKPLYKHDYIDGKEESKDKKSKKTIVEEQTNESSSKKTEEPKEEKGGGDNKEETGSEASNENGYEIVDAEDIEDNEEQEEDTEPKKTK